MKKNNPFKYSLDNKRYHTFTYYCLNRYGTKIIKLPLQLGFTCPNRDGSKSIGGCLFCNAHGSGEFNKNHSLSIEVQYKDAINRYSKKWNVHATMPYFQSFTNTYCSCDLLMQKVNELKPFKEQIKAIAFATRVDCIDDQMLNYLNQLNKSIDVWVELGVQTSNDQTKIDLNCCHTNQQAIDTVNRLKQCNIDTVIHMINGLPNESKKDMLNTIHFINQLNPTAVKFTMLHILDNSPLGKIYQDYPFPILSMEQYLDILVEQLQHLNPNIVVERICGDGDRQHIIVPNWTEPKIQVMNELDKKLSKEDKYQGQLYSHEE